MDKLDMAHQYAMNYLTALEESEPSVLVSLAWQYADAMQAEADKRKPSGLPDALIKHTHKGEQ